MSWEERTPMSQRKEFAQLAMAQTIQFRELCRRYGISPRTGYKWLTRARQQAPDFSDRSRRPHTSPCKTSDALELDVVTLRRSHPTWGGRKIAARLVLDGRVAVPAPSTITGILRRHGLLDDAQSQKHTAWRRFEHDRPNRLWQMDFKGHFAISDGRCHPLTILDDYSRFNIALRACKDERGATVKPHLIDIFRLFGLPDQMLMDNGAPWADPQRIGVSRLEAWLMRLGVRILHGAPRHPQTQGKEERFHRTLKADVLQFAPPMDFPSCQPAFDGFRHIYNHERPHEALGMQVPASRYSPSMRQYSEILDPIEYSPEDQVRKVFSPGQIRFHKRTFVVGKGLVSETVAIRPTLEDGLFQVIYCNSVVRQIDLRASLEEG